MAQSGLTAAKGLGIEAIASTHSIDLAGPIVYLVCINALAFAAFGLDKARAQRGEWRISEKALMLLAVLGGAPGALLGMRVFHHKTRKPLFSIGVPAAFVVQVALAIWFAVAVAFMR